MNLGSVIFSFQSRWLAHEREIGEASYIYIPRWWGAGATQSRPGLGVLIRCPRTGLIKRRGGSSSVVRGRGVCGDGSIRCWWVVRTVSSALDGSGVTRLTLCWCCTFPLPRPKTAVLKRQEAPACFPGTLHGASRDNPNGTNDRFFCSWQWWEDSKRRAEMACSKKNRSNHSWMSLWYT